MPRTSAAAPPSAAAMSATCSSSMSNDLKVKNVIHLLDVSGLSRVHIIIYLK